MPTPTSPTATADARAPELDEAGVSLYVHLPFCVSKCRYCDFNSWAWTGQSLEAYVDALLDEARRRATGLRPQTVFLGGGTPSLLPAGLLARLLDELDAITGFRTSSRESTMEANPESFDDARADAARAGGIDRISLGVQSLQPEVLRAYDRVHDGAQALDALARARARFPRVNADLIFAFPGQDPSAWEDDLQRVLDAGPDHVSCYELSYEPGTALTRLRDAGRWQAEEAELCAELYARTGELCAAHGLRRYETSNHARPGAACLHNLAAWRSLDYVGIGAGAAGWRDGLRRKNLDRPEAYQDAIRAGRDPIADEERPDVRTLVFDCLMMGLRLLDEGVDRARVRRISGSDPLDVYGDALRRARDEGLVEWDDARIRTTARGALLLDTLLTRLLPGTPV